LLYSREDHQPAEEKLVETAGPGNDVVKLKITWMRGTVAPFMLIRLLFDVADVKALLMSPPYLMLLHYNRTTRSLLKIKSIYQSILSLLLSISFILNFIRNTMHRQSLTTCFIA
jgi:hypothetical protein